jgi:hypothetical protein
LGSHRHANGHFIPDSKFDFTDHEVSAMTQAYERALATLKISDRSDPKTESIALAILQRLRAGESDPVRLAEFAWRTFGQ